MGKYRVDFWDSFDRWIVSGLPSGTDPENEFDNLDKAIELCKEKQVAKPPNTMGEHYGVIDLDIQKEVFCGKNWYKATDEKKRIKVTVDNVFDMNVNQLLTGIVFEICNMPITGNKEIYERHAKIVTMIARIRQQLGIPLDIEEIKIK